MANSDMMRVIRDDNIDTCAVFSPLVEAPWYTDFIIPLYFVNKTETVTVEIFGGNIGCSSGDEAMFYIMPISNWNDSSSLFGRRETCRFHESTSVVGTCAQRCAYRCKYSVESLALRVIRIPRDKPQTGWKICEMSNLLYGRFKEGHEIHAQCNIKFDYYNLYRLLYVFCQERHFAFCRKPTLPIWTVRII